VRRDPAHRFLKMNFSSLLGGGTSGGASGPAAGLSSTASNSLSFGSGGLSGELVAVIALALVGLFAMVLIFKSN
jgi:hypothetical protein